MTWLRGIGASLFFFGGVIPLAWFMVTRARSLKSASGAHQEMDDLAGDDLESENQPKAEEHTH